MAKKTSKSKLHLTRPLDRPIVLVGLMGAGKTTVGRRLAARLDVGFADTDAEIEAAAGRSVSEIFEKYGEAEFRNGERRVIARLLGGSPQVLATGGGAFVDSETRARVRSLAYSIWLKADIDLLVERVSRRDTRPLLRSGNPSEVLTKLLAERGPIYAEADLVIESGTGPHENIVDAIIEALNRYRDPLHNQLQPLSADS